jgi:uncharacterized protein (DUF3820 family)
VTRGGAWKGPRWPKEKPRGRCTKEQRRLRREQHPTLMPYGEYKGRPLSDVPTGRLAWYLRQGVRHAALRMAMEVELEHRSSPVSSPSSIGSSPPMRGRPKRDDINLDLAVRLRAEGLSWRVIAKQMSVPVSTLHDALHGKKPTDSPSEKPSENPRSATHFSNTSKPSTTQGLHASWLGPPYNPQNGSSSSIEKAISILQPPSGEFETRRSGLDDEKPARVTVPPRATVVPFPRVSNHSPSESNGSTEPARNSEQAMKFRHTMKLRLVERHPRLWEDCLRFIELDLWAFGLNWADFLALDDRYTTNPAALYNPIGHYRSLFRREKSEAIVALRESARVPLEVREPARCTKCDRSGALASGEFCDCVMGRDLAKRARWDREKAAREQAG